MARVRPFVAYAIFLCLSTVAIPFSLFNILYTAYQAKNHDAKDNMFNYGIANISFGIGGGLFSYKFYGYFRVYDEAIKFHVARFFNCGFKELIPAFLVGVVGGSVTHTPYVVLVVLVSMVSSILVLLAGLYTDASILVPLGYAAWGTAVALSSNIYEYENVVFQNGTLFHGTTIDGINKNLLYPFAGYLFVVFLVALAVPRNFNNNGNNGEE